MKSTFFYPRILALSLTLSLSLPSPALALRPMEPEPGSRTRAGLEEALEAGPPQNRPARRTAGLEEGNSRSSFQKFVYFLAGLTVGVAGTTLIFNALRQPAPPPPVQEPPTLVQKLPAPVPEFPGDAPKVPRPQKGIPWVPGLGKSIDAGKAFPVIEEKIKAGGVVLLGEIHYLAPSHQEYFIETVEKLIEHGVPFTIALELPPSVERMLREMGLEAFASSSFDKRFDYTVPVFEILTIAKRHNIPVLFMDADLKGPSGPVNRDKTMASRLHNALRGKGILAVVGASHLGPVSKFLMEEHGVGNMTRMSMAVKDGDNTSFDYRIEGLPRLTIQRAQLNALLNNSGVASLFREVSAASNRKQIDFCLIKLAGRPAVRFRRLDSKPLAVAYYNHENQIVFKRLDPKDYRTKEGWVSYRVGDLPVRETSYEGHLYGAEETVLFLEDDRRRGLVTDLDPIVLKDGGKTIELKVVIVDHETSLLQLRGLVKAGLEEAERAGSDEEIQRVLGVVNVGIRGIFHTYPVFKLTMERFLWGEISLAEAVDLSSGEVTGRDILAAVDASARGKEADFKRVRMSRDAALSRLVAAWETVRHGLGRGGFNAIAGLLNLSATEEEALRIFANTEPGVTEDQAQVILADAKTRAQRVQPQEPTAAGLEEGAVEIYRGLFKEMGEGKLGELVSDPKIGARLQTGENITIVVDVEKAASAQGPVGRLFFQEGMTIPSILSMIQNRIPLSDLLQGVERQLSEEGAGKGDLALLDPAVVESARNQWDDLFKQDRYSMPAIEMTEEALKTLEALVESRPNVAAAFLAGILSQKGLVTIVALGIQEEAGKLRLYIYA